MALRTMQIRIYEEAVSHPQKTPTSTLVSPGPIIKDIVLHMGETTFDLQDKFFLISSQSWSVPPTHQNESLKVQIQLRNNADSRASKYLTEMRASCLISKANMLVVSLFIYSAWVEYSKSSSSSSYLVRPFFISSLFAMFLLSYNFNSTSD